MRGSRCQGGVKAGRLGIREGCIECCRIKWIGGRRGNIARIEGGDWPFGVGYTDGSSTLRELELFVGVLEGVARGRMSMEGRIDCVCRTAMWWIRG